MSLIQSAKLNGHDPYAYMKDVLTRLPTQRIAAAQQAALEAVAFAKKAGKPLVKDKLDFSQKKKQLAALKGGPRVSRRRRQLTSFGYALWV